MKRVSQSLTLICVALLSIAMLTACATAPQEQPKAGTGGGTPGLYKSEEYRFTLNYPEHWKIQKTQLSTEVLRVANPNAYLIPVLVATVKDLGENDSLDPKAFTDSAMKSSPGSKRYKVLEQEDLALNDGTPAKAFTYKWTFSDGMTKLVTGALVTIKDGKIFSSTVTTILGGDTKPAQLLEIAKSWKFF
jgi:hypothetical protein